MSKPNLLYYFRRKEDIHATLMQRLLDTWLAPLRELDDIGDPLTELRSYIRRKLEMARDFPRESRLFANEILQGAPRIMPMLEGELKDAGRREGRGHQGLDARRQDRQDRPVAPDLLDLGDDPALCRFRRPGPRRARPGPRRRRPLRGCGEVPRAAVRRRAEAEKSCRVQALRRSAGSAAINGMLLTVVPILAVEFKPLRVNAPCPGNYDKLWWIFWPTSSARRWFADYAGTTPASSRADAIAFLVSGQFRHLRWRVATSQLHEQDPTAAQRSSRATCWLLKRPWLADVANSAGRRSGRTTPNILFPRC